MWGPTRCIALERPHMSPPELLRPSTSQLLVVDVQDRLARVISGIDEVTENCRRLLLAGQELAVPTLVSEQYPQGLGRTLASLSALVDPSRVREKVEFS